MSNNDKQWIDITPSPEDAAFVRWTTPGMVLEGDWRGHTERGHFGPQGAISTPDGLVLFAMPVVLREALSQAHVGDLVRITYTGDRVSKTGHSYKLFRVQKAAREPARAEQEKTAGDTSVLVNRLPDDDDLPF